LFQKLSIMKKNQKVKLNKSGRFSYYIEKIRCLVRRVYKSNFGRDVALVTAGTAGAQIITIAFSPIITRLYGPKAFGLLGTFLAITSVIAPISALTYPIAIVLPKEDSVAKGIARLSIYIALAIATMVAIVFLLGGDRLINLLKIQEIRSFILLIPLFIIFSAWLQIIQQWLIRKKQFKIKAKIAVLKAFIINIAILLIGFFRPLAAVLIVIYTFGNALHAYILSIGAKKVEMKNRNVEKTYHKTTIWQLAKKHYDFPLYRSPQVFINSISQSLPILMLAAFFGPVSAGFYTICKKVLEMPSQLVGRSVGDVFYCRIVEAAHRGENLANLILKATIGLALVGISPFAIVITYGPRLFGFIFGSEWMIAGEYARWLSIPMFFFLVNKPSVAAIPVLRMQKGFLIYEFLSTGSKLIVFYIGFLLLKKDILIIALFSIFGALAYIFLIIWVIVYSVIIERRI